MPFQSSSPVFTPCPHSYFPVTQLSAAPSRGHLQPVNICSASYSTSQSAFPQNWTYPVGGPCPVLCSEDALRKSPVSLYSCHSTCLVVHDRSGLTPALTLSCLEIVLSKTSFWPLEESNARWHGQDIRPNADHRLVLLNSAS